MDDAARIRDLEARVRALETALSNHPARIAHDAGGGGAEKGRGILNEPLAKGSMDAPSSAEIQLWKPAGEGEPWVDTGKTDDLYDTGFVLEENNEIPEGAQVQWVKIGGQKYFDGPTCFEEEE